MSVSVDPYSQRITAFFKVLGEKRQAHAKSMQYVDRFLSTGFNVFDYIGPDERMLSRVLADLLDPQGSHGQGASFFDAFAEVVQQFEACDLPAIPPTEVRTEWRTKHIENPLRSIDIVIRFGKEYAVGIENKPWAADQSNQVLDYQRDLDSEFRGRYCLLYLTRTGGEPSRYSTGPNGRDSSRLGLISYGHHIAPWLEACIQKCESDKFRWFLRDFLDYVQQELILPDSNGASDESN